MSDIKRGDKVRVISLQGSDAAHGVRKGGVYTAYGWDDIPRFSQHHPLHRNSHPNSVLIPVAGGFYQPMGLDQLEVVAEAEAEAPQGVSHWLQTIQGPRIPSPLPEESEARKEYPLARGLFDYFPAALAAVARHSYKGNQKHTPGQPLQHARHLSSDHMDAALRHLMERDLEGAAWRVLAALQIQLESEGAPVAPAATFG